MKSENAPRLLFQQIAVYRPRTHHYDLVFERGTLGGSRLELLFGCRNLVIERNKTQVTALSRDQVIAKIEGQGDTDHDDQVLAEQVFLFDESLHPSNESHLSLHVKQKHDMNQRVVWVQLGNRIANRFF